MIPKPLVKQILDRDEHECVLGLPGCLRTATVADHRANRGMGGSKAIDKPVNLVAACGLCNVAKETVSGDLRADLVERGLILPRKTTTKETLHNALHTPVTDWRGRIWFLHESGAKHECHAPDF